MQTTIPELRKAIVRFKNSVRALEAMNGSEKKKDLVKAKEEYRTSKDALSLVVLDCNGLLKALKIEPYQSEFEPDSILWEPHGKYDTTSTSCPCCNSTVRADRIKVPKSL